MVEKCKRIEIIRDHENEKRLLNAFASHYSFPRMKYKNQIITQAELGKKKSNPKFSLYAVKKYLL